MDFRLLHLSDVHFGDGCRVRNGTAQEIAKAMADEVCHNLEAHGIRPIAGVICSGDFTWKAARDEFETAAEFIAHIQRNLSLPAESVVLCPGNHDVDWGTTPGFRPRKAAEKEYRDFYRKVTGLEPNDDLSTVHVLQAQGRHLIVAVLNSCRFESRFTAGLGYVGREQFDLVLDALEAHISGRQMGDCARLAVLHHHLVPLHDPPVRELLESPEKRHFSLTVDSATLLSDLIAADFSVVLHGHMHHPVVCVETRTDLMPPVRAGSLAALSAGSYGVNGEHCKANHFQVLDIGEKEIVVNSFAAEPRESGLGWSLTSKTVHRASLRRSGAAYERNVMESQSRRFDSRARESWLMGYWILVKGDDTVAEEFFTSEVLPAAEMLGVRPDLRERWAELLAALRQRERPLDFFQEKMESADGIDFLTYVVELLGQQ
jgi:DNA repair exonuclease SbcCD nuclease subunit